MSSLPQIQNHPGATVSEDKKARAAASKKEADIDAVLVAQFTNEGSEDAFNEIVSRHREKLFSVALALLRNRSDAEEIVQDAFVRAHRGLARFRGDSSLSTWLNHITVNLARNRYWYFFRRRRQDTISLDCDLSAGAESSGSNCTFSDLVASDAPTAPREAVMAEFTELVAVCMGKLDSNHREILTMRAVLNRSYDEIALALGTNVGTVKSRIARARGQLRAKMAESCPEFAAEGLHVEWFETERSRAQVA